MVNPYAWSGAAREMSGAATTVADRVVPAEYRSMDVAAQDRHFVAQHDDIEEIGVTAADESDELEGAAERR